MRIWRGREIIRISISVSIQTKCACGATFKAKSEMAGKRVKCPACSQPLTVPNPVESRTAIDVVCQCGKSLRAKPALVGKQVKCPACGQPLVVQAPVQGVEERQLDDLIAGDISGDDPLGLDLGLELGTDQTFDDVFGDELPQATATIAPLPVSRVPEQSVDEKQSHEKKQLQIDGTMIAVISYLTLPGWIVAFVLHTKSDEKTSLGAFHLRQSAGLLCLGILLSTVMSVLFAFVPFARGFGGVVISLVSLATTVHWIYGLVSAARGEEDYLISSLGDAFDGLFPWIN